MASLQSSRQCTLYRLKSLEDDDEKVVEVIKIDDDFERGVRGAEEQSSKKPPVEETSNREREIFLRAALQLLDERDSCEALAAIGGVDSFPRGLGPFGNTYNHVSELIESFKAGAAKHAILKKLKHTRSFFGGSGISRRRSFISFSPQHSQWKSKFVLLRLGSFFYEEIPSTVSMHHGRSGSRSMRQRTFKLTSGNCKCTAIDDAHSANVPGLLFQLTVGSGGGSSSSVSAGSASNSSTRIWQASSRSERDAWVTAINAAMVGASVHLESIRTAAAAARTAASGNSGGSKHNVSLLRSKTRGDTAVTSTILFSDGLSPAEASLSQANHRRPSSTELPDYVVAAITNTSIEEVAAAAAATTGASSGLLITSGDADIECGVTTVMTTVSSSILPSPPSPTTSAAGRGRSTSNTTSFHGNGNTNGMNISFHGRLAEVTASTATAAAAAAGAANLAATTTTATSNHLTTMTSTRPHRKETSDLFIEVETNPDSAAVAAYDDEVKRYKSIRRAVLRTSSAVEFIRIISKMQTVGAKITVPVFFVKNHLDIVGNTLTTTDSAAVFNMPGGGGGGGGGGSCGGAPRTPTSRKHATTHAAQRKQAWKDMQRDRVRIDGRDVDGGEKGADGVLGAFVSRMMEKVDVLRRRSRIGRRAQASDSRGFSTSTPLSGDISGGGGGGGGSYSGLSTPSAAASNRSSGDYSGKAPSSSPPPTTNINVLDLTDAVALGYARDILAMCNRTQTGGDAYLCIHALLCPKDEENVCILTPLGVDAEPVEISVDVVEVHELNPLDKRQKRDFVVSSNDRERGGHSVRVRPTGSSSRPTSLTLSSKSRDSVRLPLSVRSTTTPVSADLTAALLAAAAAGAAGGGGLGNNVKRLLPTPLLVDISRLPNPSQIAALQRMVGDSCDDDSYPHTSISSTASLRAAEAEEKAAHEAEQETAAARNLSETIPENLPEIVLPTSLHQVSGSRGGVPSSVSVSVSVSNRSSPVVRTHALPSHSSPVSRVVVPHTTAGSESQEDDDSFWRDSSDSFTSDNTPAGAAGGGVYTDQGNNDIGEDGSSATSGYRHQNKDTWRTARAAQIMLLSSESEIEGEERLTVVVAGDNSEEPSFPPSSSPSSPHTITTSGVNGAGSSTRSGTTSASVKQQLEYDVDDDDNDCSFGVGAVDEEDDDIPAPTDNNNSIIIGEDNEDDCDVDVVVGGGGGFELNYDLLVDDVTDDLENYDNHEEVEVDNTEIVVNDEKGGNDGDGDDRGLAAAENELTTCSSVVTSDTATGDTGISSISSTTPTSRAGNNDSSSTSTSGTMTKNNPDDASVMSDLTMETKKLYVTSSSADPAPVDPAMSTHGTSVTAAVASRSPSVFPSTPTSSSASVVNFTDSTKKADGQSVSGSNSDTTINQATTTTDIAATATATVADSFPSSSQQSLSTSSQAQQVHTKPHNHSPKPSLALIATLPPHGQQPTAAHLSTDTPPVQVSTSPMIAPLATPPRVPHAAVAAASGNSDSSSRAAPLLVPLSEANKKPQPPPPPSSSLFGRIISLITPPRKERHPTSTGTGISDPRRPSPSPTPTTNIHITSTSTAVHNHNSSVATIANTAAAASTSTLTAATSSPLPPLSVREGLRVCVRSASRFRLVDFNPQDEHDCTTAIVTAIYERTFIITSPPPPPPSSSSINNRSRFIDSGGGGGGGSWGAATHGMMLNEVTGGLIMDSDMSASDSLVTIIVDRPGASHFF